MNVIRNEKKKKLQQTDTHKYICIEIYKCKTFAAVLYIILFSKSTAKLLVLSKLH